MATNISVHYRNITKLYNFLKKMKLIAWDRCFISNVKMIDLLLIWDEHAYFSSVKCLYFYLYQKHIERKMVFSVSMSEI